MRVITLYTFGPAFGLPDPSPFVTKAEVLLKMSGLAYRTRTGGLGKAPKGKLPFIDDDGVIVADSALIRMHLETRHGIDFDAGLSPAEKGAAWAVAKMMEEHLYWAVVRERWLDPVNFDKGPRRFFDSAPVLLRPIVVAMVKRQVRRNLHGQGMGRYTPDELERIAARGIDAVAGMLGPKPWLMGEAPCGADATVWAFTAGCLCDRFQTCARTRMESHANLVDYRNRGLALWYPELAAA